MGRVGGIFDVQCGGGCGGGTDLCLLLLRVSKAKGRDSGDVNGTRDERNNKGGGAIFAFFWGRDR